MTRIVIVAPSWLGDAVMALPAVADLRREWPEAEVGVAARPSLAPLFTLVDGVDRLTPLDRSWDVALLLPNSFHSAWTAVRAGIRERWGYRGDWRGSLLTRPIDRPRGEVHQTAYYQRLVRELGFATVVAAPRIDTAAALRDAARERLEHAGCDLGAPLVAMAPGAAYGGAKRWPPDQFADLALRLAALGAGAVLVGSAGDRDTGDEIEAALGGRLRVPNLIGRTDLPMLAGVLAACRALVSNDSGAMHLGAALGISVIALFGPTNERTTAPLAHTTVLDHPVWCRPCMLRECALDHRCMRGIGVDRVLAAARRTL